MNWSGPQLAGNWDVLWHYTAQHIRFTVLALLIGSTVAFALGWLAHRRPRLYPPLLGTCNALYAVPSLAMFVLLGSLLGALVDDRPVILAMAIYTLAILLRNLVEGLRAVPPSVVDAAVAMGYGPTRLFFTVELPLALPAVIAGLRVAAVSTISLITVGGFVGRGALGQLFNDGYRRDIPVEVWSAMAAVVLLAAAVDAAIAFGGRLATPWVRARTPT